MVTLGLYVLFPNFDSIAEIALIGVLVLLLASGIVLLVYGIRDMVHDSHNSHGQRQGGSQTRS